MKIIMIAYMSLYLLVTLLAAAYSYLKTRRMNRLCLFLTLGTCLLLLVTLISYSQGYHPLQMVGFAVGFTLISSLFLYNGTREGAQFAYTFLFSAGRFLLHLQFLILLYIFR
ncbi:hypothetical protein [Streptococcus acidominimus]|uniref:Membrane protein n=1 Tax=Streptococcus acidominimus TaxID=1326 RepID=A0A1Q8EG96_STRAI|nr:hypothetical protein [Streptococcus acidominimus]OLF50830.1 hypothetical protein BU200_00380 [Streptococcus acidominimus]SUN07950.1 membrane protein [Streptococcus acidominimus]